MISYFSFYKPLFMLQLLIAEFLFTFRLPKRSKFFLRFSLMVVLCFALSILLPFVPEGALSLSLLFFGLFAVTFLCQWFCYDVSALSMLFCLTVSYVVQHCAYCLSNCMLLFSNLNSNIYGVYTEEIITYHLPVNDVFGYIFSFVVYYLSYYLFFLAFGYKIRKNTEPKLKNISLFVVSFFALIISIFVNSAVIYGTTNGDLIVVINIYNAVCCVFMVYVLFSMVDKNKMEAELSSVYHILRKSEEQYEISKKTIDLIDIKCHDLKQQIRTIGQANLINETALSEISDVISIYDTEMNTGNKPLDVILTEKSLLCYQNGILLSCMADGTLLNFMNEAEIYSLFGNALDNAISAVLKIEDRDKRCIGLSLCKVKGFITVNIHNYFEDFLHYSKDGLPETTKKDKEKHGFGLKSIRYIASKYGGTVSVKTENNVFNLNVLFPIKGAVAK